MKKKEDFILIIVILIIIVVLAWIIANLDVLFPAPSAQGFVESLVK